MQDVNSLDDMVRTERFATLLDEAVAGLGLDKADQGNLTRAVLLLTAWRIGKLLVDLREAAKLLSVSPRHLHGLARTGEVPSIVVGRRRLFSPAALAAWAAGKANGGEQ